MCRHYLDSYMVNWNWCWFYSPRVARRSVQATGDANKDKYCFRHLLDVLVPDKHRVSDSGSNRQQTQSASVDDETIQSGRSFTFKSGA
jgi:hypothetical protein